MLNAPNEPYGGWPANESSCRNCLSKTAKYCVDIGTKSNSGEKFSPGNGPRDPNFEREGPAQEQDGILWRASSSAVVTHEQGGRITSWWIEPAPGTEIYAIKVSCGAVETQQWTTAPAQRLGATFAGWLATAVASRFGKPDLTVAVLALL